MESITEIKKYFPILKFHYKILIETPLNQLLKKAVLKKKRKKKKGKKINIQSKTDTRDEGFIG